MVVHNKQLYALLGISINCGIKTLGTLLPSSVPRNVLPSNTSTQLIVSSILINKKFTLCIWVSSYLSFHRINLEKVINCY